jgi:hypothetical protein
VARHHHFPLDEDDHFAIEMPPQNNSSMLFSSLTVGPQLSKTAASAIRA